jgi:hypothetical protein
MRSDRYTRAVLTVIAIGLWALTLSQMAPSQAIADLDGAPAAALRPTQEAVGPVGETYITGPARTTGIAPAAPSSRPLRWRVSCAAASDSDTAGTNECSTVISVLNTHSVGVPVDVELFNESAALEGSASFTLAAGDSQNAITFAGSGADSSPFFYDQIVVTGDFFGGFARVHADDPRVIVSAFLMCKEDGGVYPVRSISHIPAFPVGATAEFFQAGMPATRTPPLVEPEVPE